MAVEYKKHNSEDSNQILLSDEDPCGQSLLSTVVLCILQLLLDISWHCRCGMDDVAQVTWRW